jgi:S-methylmethionine-dependent homocysteine/selenocysteine methylase
LTLITLYAMVDNSAGSDKGIAVAKYRDNLPQLNGNIFITDGGPETTFIFHDGLELPLFASFVLLKSDEGRRVLQQYYSSYAAIANKYQVGFILESMTWRASTDWGRELGYSDQELSDANRQAIEMLKVLRNQYENEHTKIVISGCIGPREDGYNPSHMMKAEEAEHYHTAQIRVMSETDADLVSAATMTYTEEAIGITRAAQSVGLPVVISFTVETDGKLPSGETIQEAIAKVDAATNNGPAYYMINCAHPTHFANILEANDPNTSRLRGIRANASSMSHAELDEAEELDDGNPVEFGQQYYELREQLSHLNVLGGCCGTDHRHIEEICKSCVLPA